MPNSSDIRQLAENLGDGQDLNSLLDRVESTGVALVLTKLAERHYQWAAEHEERGGQEAAQLSEAMGSALQEAYGLVAEPEENLANSQ